MFQLNESYETTHCMCREKNLDASYTNLFKELKNGIEILVG